MQPPGIAGRNDPPLRRMKLRVSTEATSTGLAIRLRRSASFQEKLRQLVDKYTAKRRPKAPFAIAEAASCGKFERSD
jgi:hypothetical protein